MIFTLPEISYNVNRFYPFKMLRKSTISKNFIHEIINSNNGYSCGSGDSFVSGPIAIKVDVVDMEAYALAKICKLEKINFRCFKFISDNADEAASEDWIKNCEKGAKLFKHKLKQLNLLKL